MPKRRPREKPVATVAALQRELRRAIRSTVARAKRELVGQTLYGVALAIGDGSGTAGGMAFGTVERLEAQVDEAAEFLGPKAAGRGRRAGLRDRIRWECEEAGWHFDSASFEAVQALSSELVHGAGQEVEDLFATRLGYLQLQAALAEADHAGLFGRGVERERVVLILYAGDHTDEDLVEWARPMNPDACVVRLAAELRHAVRARARMKRRDRR